VAQIPEADPALEAPRVLLGRVSIVEEEKDVRRYCEEIAMHDTPRFSPPSVTKKKRRNGKSVRNDLFPTPANLEEWAMAIVAVPESPAII
jgi:hypothetical protein